MEGLWYSTTESIHMQSKFRASGLCTSREVRRERIIMRFTPEINMPPCHTCTRITAPLPDVSASVCELGDEAAAVAPAAAAVYA